MNKKRITDYFYCWLKNKSAERVTHSKNYAKYEIERLLSEQSEAELIFKKDNILICRCRYCYVLHKSHSLDNEPHIFEFEAIGCTEFDSNKYGEYKYFDYIITHR